MTRRKVLTKRRYDRVNGGDSWIKIANKHGISLDELLMWNGVDPSQEPPILQKGQRVIVKNPFQLDASLISEEAPKDYEDWGPQGRVKINQWADAWRSGQVKYEDVPEIYRIPAFQQYIKGGISDFNRKFGTTVGNGFAFLTNPLWYLAGVATQKGAAYGYDWLSGKNEYGAKDFFKYTPILGRDFASQHPVLSATVDMATGMFGPRMIQSGYQTVSNPQFWNSVSNNAMSSASTYMGPRAAGWKIPVQTGTVRSGGGTYTSGTKGFGNVSSVKGNPSVGYRPVVGKFGTFSNNFSAGNRIKLQGTSQFNPVAIPWSPIPMPTSTGPLWYMDQDPPTYIIPQEEKHIYERWNRNRWQDPNPTGEVAPYVPGTGAYSVEGRATIGLTPYDQAIKQETMRTFPYLQPRAARYVPGPVTGTPTNIYSGLGHTYDSDNPGALIIGQ